MPTKTLAPPQHKIHASEPIKADQWKNLSFTKSGKSYRGFMVHPSEQAARKRSEENDEEIRNIIALGLAKAENILCDSMDGEFFFSEYSHTFQIPWKD